MDDKARVVWRFTAVLPSVDVNKAPFLVLVSTDIADLSEGILVWEGEVKDVCRAAGTLADIAGVVTDCRHMGKHAASRLHVLPVSRAGGEIQGTAVIVCVLAVGRGGTEAGGGWRTQ